MKRFVTALAILLLIFEILMFPKDAMSYAAMGLTLWFDTMIPALFPFMVLSALIIRLDLAHIIVSFLHPVLYAVFRTNYSCEYVMVMGFLCGYPMGAVIIKDLLHENKITTEQAEYLLAFCNNIGPVFFCSVVLPIFEAKYTVFLLFCMYGIPLLYGILLRYTLHKNTFSPKNAKHSQNTVKPIIFSDAFTDAINQSVSSVLFLGACMIFFNMLRFFPSMLCKNSFHLQTLFAWCFEVNGALEKTAVLYNQGSKFYVFTLLPLLQIGGLSCIAQTTGILNGSNCRIFQYLMHKMIQALFWFLLVCFLLPCL